MAREKEKIEIDPRVGNDRVGLMITRGQVEHLGHAALKSQMMLDNGRNIVGFGSSEKSGESGNPLTPGQKRRAQQGAWGDAFSIVFLQDIGATDRSTDWADYVFDSIRGHRLPEPTDFYAGSVRDARWYEAHFASMKGDPGRSRGSFRIWENPRTGKRIHILDRGSNLAISSSDVRALIERRDPAWRDFVPARLWDFYDWEYPPALRDAIPLPGPGRSGWPVEGRPEDKVPTGTKGIVRGSGEVMILRADGVWRPRTGAEGAKSAGD